MTVENRTGPDNGPVSPRPPLRPPGNAHAETRQGAPSGRILLWAFVAALLLVPAVIFLLPQWVSAPRSVVPEAVKEVRPPAAGADVAEARKQAELGLQQVLRLQAALKLANAPAWAQQEWDQALSLLSAGDRSFGERDFVAAGDRYQQAFDLLQSVQDNREQRLQQALEAGRAALASDRIEQAIALYEQALQIEPDHEQAVEDLARARVRSQVLDAMQAADAAETAGDLAVAIASVQSALSLDADYPPAQSALARLEQRAAGEAFAALIDEALQALDRGRLADSGRALDKAAQLDPQHPSLTDARQRLAVARQQSALTGIRRQTRKMTADENWEAAAGAYRRALKIDANAGFARQGLQLAEKRAAVHRQFDHYLDEPERLYSAEPLANAERLLDAVVDIPAAEPKLREKRRRLTVLVEQARQPLRVDFRSDGQTEVVVYHVGRLGSFTDHSLRLKPGTYTAVGSRPGFRDVRRVFTLTPGQPAQVVEIRCEEPV